MFAHSATTATTWNGGWCPICTSAYLGAHRCDPEALVRRAHELLDMARAANAQRGCPCRPESGGSGVCGCTLGGPKVTC